MLPDGATRHSREAPVIGYIAAALGGVLGLRDAPAPVVALVGTGFCGTLTTFSTFGYDVVRPVEERAVLRVTGYLAATLLLGAGVAAAAYLLARG
jgi:CrcB protein